MSQLTSVLVAILISLAATYQPQARVWFDRLDIPRKVALMLVLSVALPVGLYLYAVLGGGVSFSWASVGQVVADAATAFAFNQMAGALTRAQRVQAGIRRQEAERLAVVRRYEQDGIG